MTRRCDIVVIGAGIGGLAAAVLLARRGKRVLVLEEKLAPPEPIGALFALDPEIVSGLQLVQHGLRFVRRDLARTGWDDDGAPLTLGRDRRAAAQAIASFSRADAQAWAPFQTRLHETARTLRRLWWRPDGRAGDMPGSEAQSFARDCVTGLDAFLRLHFESPRLVSLLLQDGMAGGLSPCEPGSALALIWRAAQEMNGLQEAAAIAEPGTLVAALRTAARGAGVELHLGTSVAAIRTDQLAVRGVMLADGDEIAAGTILSSLSRRTTERLAGLEVRGSQEGIGSVGTAQLIFTLDQSVILPPELRNGRVLLAPPPEGFADAHEAARAGKLAAMPPLELVCDALGRLVATLPLVPVMADQDWRNFQAPLAASVVKAIARHQPGFADGITGIQLLAPKRRVRTALSDLLAPAATRAATRVSRVYLCGPDAEPVPCLSGRAGRFAAHFALQAP